LYDEDHTLITDFEMECLILKMESSRSTTLGHAQIDFAIAPKGSAAIHSTLVVFAGLSFW